MARRVRRRRLAFLVLALLSGCHAVLGLDDPVIDRSGGPAASGDGSSDALQVEGPLIDGRAPNPGTDGGGGDANADADAEPPAVMAYNENWDNASLWNHFDLHNINVGISSFTGAVFDGRYVYFAPSNNTNAAVLAARYDTQGNGFTITNSWSFFDTAVLHPDARGFSGAFFDGRYVYFVPFAIPGLHHGRLVRYDTQAGRNFGDAQAWSQVNLTAFEPYAKGFIGGAYDGERYAYMAPGPGAFIDGGRPESLAARYDSTLALGAEPSWQFFDTQRIDPSLNGGPRGFFGTVLTEDHLYFVPYGYGGSVRGRVVRYDQKKPFTEVAAWEVFDTAAVNPGSGGFQGGGYDGRFVYLAPLVNVDGISGVVTRFDTKQPAFTDAGSWSAFDLQTLDGGLVPSQSGRTPERRGYVGTGFDGRFMYFVGDQAVPVGYHGWIARFDSTKPDLHDPSAWSFYDTTAINPFAKGFCGAVFDGMYVYFVPGFVGSPPTENNTVVVRLHAAYALSGKPRPPKFMPGGTFL
jgi:hypothetical protein